MAVLSCDCEDDTAVVVAVKVCDNRLLCVVVRLCKHNGNTRDTALGLWQRAACCGRGTQPSRWTHSSSRAQ